MFENLFRRKKKEITPQTTIGEMLRMDQGIAQVLLQSGMHCVGCPSSRNESLTQACQVHGLDVNEVYASIQSYLEGKQNP